MHAHDDIAPGEIAGELRRRYPEKFIPLEYAFERVKRGSRVFMGTGCGQPNRLLNALLDYAESNPKNMFDSELYTLLLFGMEKFRYERFGHYFRQHCFSMRDGNRQIVNRGHGDYNAVFLSRLPGLIERNLLPLDAALVQCSLPDADGILSLGISVDITPQAVETAPLVIAQINPSMPRVGGDALISMDDIDFAFFCDEPLFEYTVTPIDEITEKIGRYAAELVEDGATIQAGFGSTAQAVLPFLAAKKGLGIHTELLSDGLVDLMRGGAVDNSAKSVDSGKTVATFCMGSRESYRFIDANPSVELRRIDYTNSPVVISRQRRMTAINGVLSVDLTGQATAESIGTHFYSGLGGTADFVRGALQSPDGRSILVLRSTAENGTVSRIVPFLREGEGVTVNRGDVHYVVTEFGVANLMGKNIRERAMELIRIAHPSFRPWLMDEARRKNLVFQDQAFITGRAGEYPEELEARRVTRSGMPVLLRPVKISDEPLLKEFIYSLSDRSMYYRYFSLQKEMPHEHLQKIVVIDYMKEMTLLAVTTSGEREVVMGFARYVMEDPNFANFSIAVRDERQNRGLGILLLTRLMQLAHRQGFSGFTLEVLLENRQMVMLINHMRKLGHAVERQIEGDTALYLLTFNAELLSSQVIEDPRVSRG